MSIGKGKKMENFEETYYIIKEFLEILTMLIIIRIGINTDDLRNKINIIIHKNNIVQNQEQSEKENKHN